MMFSKPSLLVHHVFVIVLALVGYRYRSLSSQKLDYIFDGFLNLLCQVFWTISCLLMIDLLLISSLQLKIKRFN